MLNQVLCHFPVALAMKCDKTAPKASCRRNRIYFASAYVFRNETNLSPANCFKMTLHPTTGVSSADNWRITCFMVASFCWTCFNLQKAKCVNRVPYSMSRVGFALAFVDWSVCQGRAARLNNSPYIPILGWLSSVSCNQVDPERSSANRNTCRQLTITPLLKWSPAPSLHLRAFEVTGNT